MYMPSVNPTKGIERIIGAVTDAMIKIHGTLQRELKEIGGNRVDFR